VCACVKGGKAMGRHAYRSHGKEDIKNTKSGFKWPIAGQTSQVPVAQFSTSSKVSAMPFIW